MLEQLTIEHFRCISHAELQLAGRCCSIVGANGSGKTSVLEAINFLAHARSFRTRLREGLIQHGELGLLVTGKIGGGASVSAPLNLGISFSEAGGVVLKASGEVVPVWRAAELLPTLVIDSAIHKVIEEGPLVRRRLLNWGVFHVEPAFRNAWAKYQTALRQRNAALRNSSTEKMVRVWDSPLVSNGEHVHRLCSHYCELWSERFRAISMELLEFECALSYLPGWNSTLTFAEGLQLSYANDLAVGATRVGPHRADVRITVGEARARERVSRGQQKLLAAAALLAQVQLHRDRGGSVPLLLVDDPSAELDVDNLGKLLRHLRRSPAQLIVTAIDAESLRDLPSDRVFHVEQGRINAVV